MIEIPIACNLSPADRRDRAAAWESLEADVLLSREPIEGGERSRLRYHPDVERRVRELVAAEADCCPFLSFALAREGDELRVDVTGWPEPLPR